ncbi:MAG: DUF1285 domain-containing protein [Neomegalonema sp.]|nr:DUF1285 domain-containing protein [Neomegalonema sp.]
MSNSGGIAAGAQKSGEGGAGRLDALIKAASGGAAPVHLWNPDYCGELDMRIQRDGVWFYEGTPIGRQPLVKLFASILKREGDRFFLVTPVEKVGITVEDAPFIGVDLEADGEGRARNILVETQLGDRVIIGPEHLLRIHRRGGELIPYVDMRAGLEARLDRKSLFRLAELAEPSSDGAEIGVWSGGVFFALERAETLRAEGLDF